MAHEEEALDPELRKRFDAVMAELRAVITAEKVKELPKCPRSLAPQLWDRYRRRNDRAREAWVNKFGESDGTDPSIRLIYLVPEPGWEGRHARFPGERRVEEPSRRRLQASRSL